MQHKKLLVGALTLALLLGGTYAYSEGGSLQGKFGGSSLSTTKSTGKTTGASSSTTTKPDFYFSGAVSYDSSLNYFKATVCQTNVTSADVKQTSLKFTVAGGQSDTVQFTPTAAGTSAVCQTVNSGDLLSDLLIQVDGEYDLTVVVDSTSVQTEANEGNNTLTTNDVVTESDYYLYDFDRLPDLTVMDVNTNGDYSDDSNRHIESISAMFCGASNLLAYPSENELKSYYVVSQHDQVIADGTYSIGASAFSGTSNCLEFLLPLTSDELAQLTTGTVTMNLQIDTTEKTPESDEDNNGFGQSFTDEIVVD